jgi:hypothetical protein
VGFVQLLNGESEHFACSGVWILQELGILEDLGVGLCLERVECFAEFTLLIGERVF